MLVGKKNKKTRDLNLTYIQTNWIKEKEVYKKKSIRKKSTTLTNARRVKIHE